MYERLRQLPGRPFDRAAALRVPRSGRTLATVT